MKKHETAGRIVRSLLCLSLVAAAVLGIAYARYLQEVQGRASASVAAVALDMAGSSGTLDVTAQLSGMRPGDARTVEFAVTNAKDGTVSEVDLTYAVSLATSGNLPLTYALDPKSGSGDTANYARAAAGADLVWTGGLLPFGPSGVGVTHTYELSVTWPAGQAAERFADEIDQVTLTVDAQQAEPQTT